MGCIIDVSLRMKQVRLKLAVNKVNKVKTNEAGFRRYR